MKFAPKAWKELATEFNMSRDTTKHMVVEIMRENRCPWSRHDIEKMSKHCHEARFEAIDRFEIFEINPMGRTFYGSETLKEVSSIPRLCRGWELMFVDRPKLWQWDNRNCTRSLSEGDVPRTNGVAVLCCHSPLCLKTCSTNSTN